MGFGDLLADRLERSVQAVQWQTDPAAWAAEYLGAELWSKQREIAQSVIEHRATAVQSAAGVGKTYLASILAVWFGSVHPQYDVKIVSTAPTADQVSLYLWSEIRKHHDAAIERDRPLPGRVLLNNHWMADNGAYVIGYGRKPPDYAKAAFQGAHAEHMLVIVDEAGGIKADMWANIRSIMTNEDASVLAIGNPDDSSSEFAKMCAPGSVWNTIKISALDSPNFTGEKVSPKLAATLPSHAYVNEAREAWGEDNPYFRAKILGEFADAEDGLIPLSWINAAVARWHDWKDAGGAERGGRRVFGVDVARLGLDKTAIATRCGDVVYGIEVLSQRDNVQVADHVTDLLAYPQSMAVVDADGNGGGVVDILRHRGLNVIGFSAGVGYKGRDSTHTQRFPQVRSAAWWHMRELLNPALGATLCLPPDEHLIAELAAPKWPDSSGNIIQVERKEDIRKRLGRSTDRADAVIHSVWKNSPPEHTEARPSTVRRPRAVQYADAQFGD